MQNLSASELKARLDSGSVTLLDVRTNEELELARLEGAVHIPLAELQTRMTELNPQTPIAVLCHHGVRSELAGRLLERNGFADVSHLIGGIDAWSQAIDPAIPRY
jgi:rhodanese-related sulfurtransferase